MLNLDTHMLIFALAGDLRPHERKILAADSWGISDIVLWEISKLAQLGRINLDLTDSALQHAIGQLHIWPIDLDICLALRQLDFHRDPADEIIAATSIVHKASLVTRDAKLRKSKVVPLAI